MGPPSPRHIHNTHLQILEFSSMGRWEQDIHRDQRRVSRFPSASVAGVFIWPECWELNFGTPYKQYLFSNTEPLSSCLPSPSIWKVFTREQKYLNLSNLPKTSQPFCLSHLQMNVVVSNEALIQHQLKISELRSQSRKWNLPQRNEDLSLDSSHCTEISTWHGTNAIWGLATWRQGIH